MNPPRIIGLILLIVGVGLLVVGMNASHSISDQVSNTFTGRFTQATTWYIVGGIACGLVGIVAMIGGGRGKSA
jgi:Protein of unknown function (DUF3185)